MAAEYVHSSIENAITRLRLRPHLTNLTIENEMSNHILMTAVVVRSPLAGANGLRLVGDVAQDRQPL